jgi:LysM repeat protein
MAYVGTSIVDYLKSIGQASDYSSRAKLAAQQGISNYTGTAQQNTQLLNALNKPVSSTPAQTSHSYTIKSGDTLSQIAQKQGTTTTALMAANPQITNPDKISAGATINISTPSYSAPSAQTPSSSQIPDRAPVGFENTITLGGVTYEYSGGGTGMPGVIINWGNGVYGDRWYGAGKDSKGNPLPNGGKLSAAPVVTETPIVEQKNPLETVVETVPELKEILDVLQLQLDDKIQSGQRVNPDLTITPELTAKFVEDATKELDPYYQELINQHKQDLTISYRQLQEDYNTQIEREQPAFQQTLQGQDRAEAESGMAFSSGRKDREQQTISGQQQRLDDLFSNTQRTVEANALSSERAIGSRAFADLGIPTLQTYSAQRNTIAPRGELATTGSRNLYTPQTGLFGELPANKKTAISNRVGELTQLEINKRILDSGVALGTTSLG